jgi:AAA15 family ATPase/GTPase
MLLRFGFSNFLSVRAPQELTLTASRLKDHPSYLISEEGIQSLAVPATGIYGANASGKTNVLLALKHLVDAVLQSHTDRRPGTGTRSLPFRLDESSSSKPSQFDIDFTLSGVRYHYGFTENSQEILEEWLYAFPRGRRQVWFYRRSAERNIEFGNFLQGRNRTIEALTRPNSLFLSAAAQNNHEQLMPIFSFFRDGIIFRLDNRTDFSEFVSKLIADRQEIRKSLVKFLHFADIGITDIDLKIEKIPDEFQKLIAGFAALADEHFPATGTKFEFPTERQRILLGHASPKGERVYFDLAQESRGTRELLYLLGPVFEAILDRKVLVIDELDSSLHPLLAMKLLQMFGDANTNAHGAQLIFATHDTNLLGALRRDGIWFTEKDREGATQLYPLTDIRTRNTDNLQRGYLQGRFGGIPFLGDLNQLFSFQQENEVVS